jgi:hypothetical protein
MKYTFSIYIKMATHVMWCLCTLKILHGYGHEVFAFSNILFPEVSSGPLHTSVLLKRITWAEDVIQWLSVCLSGTRPWV